MTSINDVSNKIKYRRMWIDNSITYNDRYIEDSNFKTWFTQEFSFGFCEAIHET